MSNIKLNKKVEEKDFEVIPDIPSTTDQNEENISYVMEEEETGRKLFANKKANIALGIAGGAIVVGIIAALIFVYVV